MCDLGNTLAFQAGGVIKKYLDGVDVLNNFLTDTTGDNQHPGYHQVKEVEDNQGRAQHKLVDIREDDAGPVDKVDEEHKDVQFQQVQAPNMSPEKVSPVHKEKFSFS